jgi:hypothetical protein
METKSNVFGTCCLTLPQQIGRMSSTYPGFRATFHRGDVSWTGNLQPSAISQTFKVKIDYSLRRRPKVWVLDPKPQSPDRHKRVRHTFSDGSICLHLHDEWTPQMYIAETIVPWLGLWLLHYEAWHATGQWLGGGHESTGER